jgi:HlyD family secretion protein
MVDIPRPSQAGRRRKRAIVYAAIGLAAVALVTVLLARLRPAAPMVQRSAVWIDTVRRGPMLRQVRGLGTLVPEEVRWIPAETTGRVERIEVRPGTTVTPDTVLLVLSNPELEVEALDAAGQLRAAEAETVDLKVRLESQRLDQEAAAATVQAEEKQARLQADADSTLASQGLVSDINQKISQARAEELATRLGLEKRRLEISDEAVKAQLAVQETKVTQLRAMAELKRRMVDRLRVRAGIAGVLQQLPVEVGQQVAPGATLAKVSDPGRLKAELRIPETQARDVQLGQAASVDTRNGIATGTVSRIDPAVENGTVKVDVAFSGPLPRGARPDLSVDGTITLEDLADVLQVGRPATGQDHATVGLFRLQPGGGGAERVQVHLGRSSVSVIEILDGLKEGDQVILSDTSAWDAFDRIRLD